MIAVMHADKVAINFLLLDGILRVDGLRYQDVVRVGISKI
jgi:hypothetical protein